MRMGILLTAILLAGGATAGQPPGQHVRIALVGDSTVAEGGGWLKLSGWYRLGAAAPYSELDDTIRRAAEVFGEHCVWGSDWPHTKFLEGGSEAGLPDYLQTWLPVPRSLSDARADRLLRSNPVRLYP